MSGSSPSMPHPGRVGEHHGIQQQQQYQSGYTRQGRGVAPEYTYQEGQQNFPERQHYGQSPIQGIPLMPQLQPPSVNLKLGVEPQGLTRATVEESGLRVTSIPKSLSRQAQLDPNLVCPMCRRQFRIGEIQKYRQHVKGCHGT